jgi:hypothetical protein
MNKKKANLSIKIIIPFFAVLFLCAGAAYFYKAPLQKALSKSLFPEIDPEKIEYEHLRIEKGSLVFSNVHLIGKNYDARIEDVAIQLKSNPEKFYLFPHIAIKKPTFVINNPSAISEIESAFSCKFPLFSIAIEEGSLFFPTGNEGTLSDEVLFHFSSDFKKNSSMLSLISPLGECCKISIEKGEDAISYHVDVDSVVIGSLLIDLVDFAAPDFKGLLKPLNQSKKFSCAIDIQKEANRSLFKVSQLKSNDLRFEEISGTCISSKDATIVKDFLIKSQELTLKGNARVNFCPDQTMELKLHSREMQGDFASMIKFLQKLSLNPNAKLPFQGKIETSGEGLKVVSKIGRDAWETKCKLDAHVYDLSYTENPRINFSDIAFDFNFNSEKELFEVKNLSGECSLSPEHTLNLSATDLKVSKSLDYVSFDLQMLEDEIERLHLVGQANVNENQRIHFEFNPQLSHFYQIKPTNLTLEIKDWNRLDKMVFEHEFAFENIREELDLFEMLSLYHADSILKERLSDLPIEGSFLSKLEFSRPEHRLDFSLHGKNVFFHQQMIPELEIQGSKSFEKMKISLNAKDLIQSHCMIIKAGDTLLIPSFTTAWEENKLTAQGEFNLRTREGNFSIAPSHLFLQPLNAASSIDGQAQVTFSSDFQTAEVIGKFNAELKSEIFAKTTSPFSIYFHQKDGIVVRDLALEIIDKEEHGSLFQIEEINYDFENYHVKSAAFSLSPSLLSSYAQGLCPTDLLQGVCDLKGGNGQYEATGFFKEGSYRFGDSRFDLEELHFIANPDQFYLTGALSFENLPLKMKMTVKNDSLQLRLKEAEKQSYLAFDFSYTPERLWNCDQINGTLFGISALFQKNEENASSLTGRMKIDFEVMPSELHSLLFKGKLAAKANGYVRGDLNLKERYFRGELVGTDLSYFDHKFHYFYSALTYEPENLSLSNLLLKDKKSHVMIDSIFACRIDPDWSIKIDGINICDANPIYSERTIHIATLTGKFNNPDSFIGIGSIQGDYALLNHYSDIIGQIGVNCEELTPNKGIADFYLEKETIHIINNEESDIALFAEEELIKTE